MPVLLALLLVVVLAAFLFRLSGERQRRARVDAFLSRELRPYSVPDRPRYLVVAGNVREAEVHTRHLREAGIQRRDLVLLHDERQLHGLSGEGSTRVLLVGQWWNNPLLTNASHHETMARLRQIDPSLGG